MTWLKFSEPIFSLDYFKHLIHRYLWLVYIPLSIFLGFVFLCGVLKINLEFLGLLLFPYAVFIVPCTALIIFHVYTKKMESAHLFSMPLTRIQNFVSSYLAGLTLILMPLLTMSLIYSLTDFGENIVTFIGGMFLLAVIYYSLSVLGCLLGGTVATQLMMMGLVSFGPLLLYVMINLCVSELALGDMSTQLNSSIVNSFCPLLSGIDFIILGNWPYWFIHAILFLLIFAFCLYVVRIRPFELAGQPIIFSEMQNYLMKPVLYLCIVYLIFYFCALNLFDEGYFDTNYYSKMVTLLAGTGILVAFMLNIWSSHDFKSLFDWKHLQHTLLMTLLACSLFLIPLRQKENSRMNYPDELLRVTFNYPGYHHSITQIYDLENNKSQVNRFLESIDDARQHFIRSDTYNDKEACTLILNFLAYEPYEEMTQCYYILPEDTSGYMRRCLSDFLIDGRKDALEAFLNNNGSHYYISSAGHLYRRDTLIEAIKKTFYRELPTHYFEICDNQIDRLYESGLGWDYQYLYDIYFRAMTKDDFPTWLTTIYDQVTPVLSADDLDAIYLSACQALSHEVFRNVDDPDAKVIYENSSDAQVMQLDQWLISEANDHSLRATIYTNATLSNNVEAEDATYFEGNSVTLSYEVSFKKIDQEWIMSILYMKGVSY